MRGQLNESDDRIGEHCIASTTARFRTRCWIDHCFRRSERLRPSPGAQTTTSLRDSKHPHALRCHLDSPRSRRAWQILIIAVGCIMRTFADLDSVETGDAL